MSNFTSQEKALKDMYKAHKGGGFFNIDKLEELITKLVQEREEVEKQLLKEQHQAYTAANNSEYGVL